MIRLLFISLLLVTSSAYAQLNMDNGSVRAMPPGQPNSAAFLTLNNTSLVSIRLVEAKASVAKKAEYHSHSKDDKGVMRMAKEAYIEIPAGQSFEFKSGGHHIMLMGLHKTLTPGESVALTLGDSNGKQYSFELPVVSILSGKAEPDHSHHHH